MVPWQSLCRKALHYSATVSYLNGFRQARLVQLFRSQSGTAQPGKWSNCSRRRPGDLIQGLLLEQRTNPRKELAQKIVRPVKDKEVMISFEANEFLVRC